MDRNDAIGMVGLALFAAGIWGLGGWPWAATVVGFGLLALYVTIETRVATKAKRREEG